MASATVFEYEGRVYVRPVSRGVVMFDAEQTLYVEQAVTDGYYRMKISFERLTPEEEHQAEKDYIG